MSQEWAMWKRVFITISVVLLVLVLSVTGYWLTGSSAVESWIGTQILAMGGSYLGPDLQFSKLTYVRPRTVLVDDLALTSPDPAAKGKQITILSVKHAKLELTEIPKRGQPIRFSEIILDSPQINAVASTAGGSDMVGFSNLVRGSQNDSKPASKELAEPIKLSDVLQIRHVEITNGAIRYDSRKPDRPPLWLDGIHVQLDFSPTDSAPQTSLYKIATSITRKPAIDMTLNGQLDIDTFTLSQAKVELNVDVQEKNNHFLPSELQNLLKQFEVNGQLHILSQGHLPLLDTNKIELHTLAELTTAQVAVGKNRLAINSWQWDLLVHQGIASIRKGRASLLGGQLDLTGSIPISGNQPATIQLAANQLQIQQLLRSTNPEDSPEYAGNVTTNLLFRAPLAQWNTQAEGGGELIIRQGKLANIPVLGTITGFISNTISKTMGQKKSTLNDQADATFSFVGDHVEIHKFSGTSGALAMRGDGNIGFNQQLDLRLNAGPMERIQNSLGAVGRMWGSITDSVAGYRVTGSLSDPQISMEIGR